MIPDDFINDKNELLLHHSWESGDTFKDTGSLIQYLIHNIGFLYVQFYGSISNENAVRL
jgi:hypothetical protein